MHSTVLAARLCYAARPWLVGERRVFFRGSAVGELFFAFTGRLPCDPIGSHEKVPGPAKTPLDGWHQGKPEALPFQPHRQTGLLPMLGCSRAGIQWFD
ncbi:hypothetical protein FJTKL_09020 [Diaporthe vaccinii]|uniref:Cyclic nucleotide-binding domain-containing protein n=1 Tax=Diaporthe vaccinii TaxID=105482 RepID=A0ABR4EPF5_9PEZI